MSFKHTLIISSNKPPTVEFDPECGAVYVRFSDRKITKTVERPAGDMIVTVDLDKSENVVGIEALCFDEFTMERLLKVANVRATGIDFAKARIKSTPHQTVRTKDLEPA